jgi:hypothetical protein
MQSKELTCHHNILLRLTSVSIFKVCTIAVVVPDRTSIAKRYTSATLICKHFACGVAHWYRDRVIPNAGFSCHLCLGFNSRFYRSTYDSDRI